MLHIEEITDADIAEVHESAATFAGVRSAIEPLAGFLSLLQGERLIGILDAAPRRRPPEPANPTSRQTAQIAAFRRAEALSDILDGSLGNPVAIAHGKVAIVPAGGVEPGSRRALAQAILDATRELAETHRFTHWQLAFPNVWRDWTGTAPAGGFDAVIGNPPYVRQEQLSAFKPALAKAYRAYDGAADLYVYFYELGLRLLRPGGRLSLVVTNKWLRAGYAEELRALLSTDAWLEAVIDFGHAKGFFPAADVFPCVIVARRPDGGEAPAATAACQIPRDLVRLDRLAAQVEELAFPVPLAVFTRNAWVIEPPAVTALLDKIRRAGAPLREVVGVGPYRGILTGLNEAFLIDTPTRDALVAADPGCAGIIRPYLRGQDIDRWHAPWAGLWMIVMKSSSDHAWPWADAGERAEALFAATYPTIHRRMKPLEALLRNRQDKGRHWWELRSCAYYDTFSIRKIVYQEIQYYSAFGFDIHQSLANNKVFLLPSSDTFLGAVLNSPLMWWHNWRYLPHMKDEALTPAAFLVDQLPIADAAQSIRERATFNVEALILSQEAAATSLAVLIDWYRIEHGIERPSRALTDPFALTADAFAAEVRRARGARRPLSPAGVAAVRAAWRESVAPVAERLREADPLERELSDLVNDAYGLTPEEVRLLWQTAPPRMPLAPPNAAAAGAGMQQTAAAVEDVTP